MNATGGAGCWVHLTLLAISIATAPSAAAALFGSIPARFAFARGLEAFRFIKLLFFNGKGILAAAIGALNLLFCSN